MITSAFGYLFVIALLAAIVGTLEKRGIGKALFDFLPAVVILYILTMLLAQIGLWRETPAIDAAYRHIKNWLLPALLFLMLLPLDLRRFFTLGPSLLAAYALALVSILFAFVAIFILFGFGPKEAGIFAALAGSWTGGTANMLAVAQALGVDPSSLGQALIVDAICYGVWVMFLLLLVPLAVHFARFSGAQTTRTPATLGCSCTIGPKRYWLLLFAAFLAALFCQWAAPRLPWLGTTTWSVLIATILGVVGSLTPLSRIGGAQEIANTMLLLLIALIGSRADLSDISQAPTYVAAGFSILGVHALSMILGAKILKLDLFTIGVASLANIGGVASAPILAGAYDKRLVPVAVLMAVSGYLVGTIAGLGVGALLLRIAG